MTVYTDADLGKHLDLIVTANLMACTDGKAIRDAGTSVLGAGISVWYKAPRARRQSRKILVSAPIHLQGNVGARQACERALAFLTSHGVEATWHDGAMD